jgi:proteasome lid subunit RPN8/RPN11
MAPFSLLQIPRALLGSAITHAQAEAPNECCGLFAGFISEGVGYVLERAPIRNDLASPSAYLTNARDLFEAYRAMRSAKTELLAFYHSHPTSAPIPSRRDVEENTLGETAMSLIISLTGPEPEVRTWWLTAGGYWESEWDVSE